MKPDISDEELNACVDEELDAADRERVLAAVTADRELAQRACALRLTKDQLRHAYAEPPPAPSRRVPARPWRMLATLLLLAGAAATGWLARDRLVENPEVMARKGDATHLVLHLADWDAGRAEAALGDAEDMLRAARGAGRGVAVEVVANRSGLRLLQADLSPHAERIGRLRAEYPNLALVACGQTVERLREQGVEVRLLPGTRVASSALDEIVARMSEGWSYVRI